MQRLSLDVMATRTVGATAAATALAGLLLFTGCAASMKSSLDTPLLTPAGGTFSSSQTVTVSDTAPGVVLYCTTDGSTPTKSSPRCAQPVTVYQSETLSAVAVAPDGTSSSPVSATYTITLPAAATPVISPAGGSFTAVQTVTLSDATTGATIYYTTDGTTPTTASNVYGGPVTVSASETIEAVAISAATTISPVATASFTINFPAATPVISPAGGTFTSIQSATITDATAGATIYYTTDGTTPTVSSPVYGGAISITRSETINAVAIAPGSSVSAVASAVFKLNLTAATPVIAPAGGTFTSIQTASISDTTPGAAIYYTIDGSSPTATSTPSTGPITVSKSETINAIAVATGYANSAIATAVFTLNLPPAPLPVFTPVAGTYTTIQNVTLSDTAAGAAIFYTTDGSTPTTSSTPYTTPINVAATQTIKALATATGFSTSAVASSAYTINLPPAALPLISPAGGTFTSAQTVTITDTTPNTTIFYTTNGSTPSASSTRYTAPISVDATETVKAIATATGFTPSPVATANYTFVQAAAATPVLSPAGGTFTAPQTVTISDTTAGSSIYYTTDGSTPSNLSTKYTGPITVSTTETIKAIAIAVGFNDSAVASASFTINQTVATPLISPAGGTFTAAQTVILSDATAGATIYYTTNGTTPSASSTKYAAPFTVSATSTVEAIAIATGYSPSAVASAAFTISQVTGIPLGGVVSSGSTPIVGAAVQLYAAGTSGYGSAPTALLATPVVTGQTGAFNLGYACPAAPGDQLYLVAKGGSVGGTANADIALMTALGTCASLKSGASFTINEVTTIASVYALSAFAKAASGGGIDVGAPAPNALCVSTGAATCNYTGLVNAFKTVNNLVNTATGTALTITPFYASAPVDFLNTSTVPQARINTLADVVESCVSAAGACRALFTASTPPAVAPAVGTPPVDSLQAALNIAQNPGTNVAALYKLVKATPPYTPDLSAAPIDFTLALTFTGAGLGLAPQTSVGQVINTSMEIDAAGNVLVTGSNPKTAVSSMLAEFSNQGQGVTPATTQTASGGTPTYGGFSLFSLTPSFLAPEAIAIDQSGQIWLGNPAGPISLKVAGASFESGHTVGGEGDAASEANNITIDQSGNVWLADGPIIREVSSSGTPLSPSGGWKGTSNADGAGYQGIAHLTFNSDGSALWASDQPAVGALYDISPVDGTIDENYAKAPTGLVTKTYTPLVADASTNIYGCATSATSLNVFQRTSKSILATYPIANGRGCGTGPMIIDGLGHIFAVNAVTIVVYDSSGNIVSNTRTGILDEFTEKGVLISPSTDGFSGTSSEEATALNARAAPIGLGIDGSGDLWAVNASTGGAVTSGNVLVEFVGIAAPVLTPISVGLANGELATRP